MPTSEGDFPITARPQTIGRSEDCPIRIVDRTVSRAHATIWLNVGVPFIRDLKSQNGTWVNGKRIFDKALAPGDMIEIGQVALRVCNADESESARGRSAHPDSLHDTVPDNAFLSGTANVAPTVPKESTLREDLVAMYSLGTALGPCVRRSEALHLLLDWITEWLRVDQAATVFFVDNRLKVKARKSGRAPVNPKSIDWSTVRASLDRQTIVVKDIRSESAESSQGSPNPDLRRTLAVPISEADPPGVIYAEWTRSDTLRDQCHRELLEVAAQVLGATLARLEGEKLQSELDPGASGIRSVPDHTLMGLMGGSAMQPVRDFIKRAATTDATVLITGETGTGKELVARTIHRQSGRGTAPFVARNCAAFPESLLEDELFGHEPGAFTGATKRHKGAFDQADGGTLLLDEIGEAPLAVQSELLRVLEDQSFNRVGGQQPVQVDVRIIATTNRNLTKAAAGKFRRDLYYRLQVLTIHLPTLRERPEDIRLLAERFAKLACEQAGLPVAKLSPDARRRLEEHNWAGNVRELRNTIGRAVVFSKGAIIEAEDVVFTPSAGYGSGELPTLGVGQLADLERKHVLDAIARAGGNKAMAAKLLGIARSTLFRKIEQFKGETDENR